MRYIFLFIVLALFSCQPKHDLPVSVTLKNNWQFKEVSDTIWHTANVPGNVFSDLRNHKMIQDSTNETNLQWVSETDWDYKTTFLVDENTLNKKNLELNFEGLDTYATVYLNDSLILKANNAFRQWNVNVKPILKPENELRLVFERTSKHETIEKEKLPYELPEGNRIFTRKAQFQYGWDWGPKLNTSGIWKPIHLIAWDTYKITDLNIKQQLNDTVASLTLELQSETKTDTELECSIYINDSLYSTFKSKNKQLQTTELTLQNPKLWWPHNIGEPYLYTIKVVVSDGRTILDSISKKIGIRNVELVTEKDSIGESFYFKINDKPIYAKGANYIPQNSFQDRVENRHYEKLLTDVVDANMNMLRVWGGGIYENDIFYDLCDEKGILVWQDFMFACAMYPGDKPFLDNVQQEALETVNRLKNHPSIVLWCGNNENSEGWHRWGWQANRSVAEKEDIWSNYLKIFDSILPRTVNKLTDIPYWESSPKYGRGNPKYKTEGDAHDWWIWHDAYPFEHLENNVPRFMSEFGFQSLPSYEVIKYINQSDSIHINSESFKNHQKHSRGFELIDTYMQRDFPVPTKAEDYVYMSQLLQAYGITKGIEAQRRAKPYNMGTLYWQLNDCWPAVSWSSIDFFGNWKALHYKAKRSFENVIISSKIEGGILNTYIVNDAFEDVGGTLKMKLIDFKGTTLWENTATVYVNADSSSVKHQLDLGTLNFNVDEVVMVSEFNTHKSHFYFVKPKDLKLLKSPIQKTITKVSDGFSIELESEALQKNVFLFSPVEGHFSDNYIDVLANQVVKIHFKTKAKTLEELQIKTLNNFIR